MVLAQSPHRSMPWPRKKKSRHCHRRKHITSQLSKPRSNLARRNPITDDLRAQDHPAQSFFPCTADAPPISSAPQTQSMPHRHGNNPLVAIQRTGPPLACIPSQVQDHPAISFFSFYAPAPPGSCDARVLPVLRASPAQILRCSSIRWKTPL
jgi:hypothetical protein